MLRARRLLRTLAQHRWRVSLVVAASLFLGGFTAFLVLPPTVEDRTCDLVDPGFGEDVARTTGRTVWPPGTRCTYGRGSDAVTVLRPIPPARYAFWAAVCAVAGVVVAFGGTWCAKELVRFLPVEAVSAFRLGRARRLPARPALAKDTP